MLEIVLELPETGTVLGIVDGGGHAPKRRTLAVCSLSPLYMAIRAR